MTFSVTIVGKCTDSPPTRSDLLQRLRRASPRGYHASSSYLWTEDNFFSCLVPVQFSVANCSSCCYYAFAAEWSCGGNDDDVRVAVMALVDLTARVEDIVAVVTEKDGPLLGGSEENKEIDVLLLELSDVVEQSDECRRRYLRRWGAAEHNYHYAMLRRVMLSAGGVYIIPLSQSPLKPQSLILEKEAARYENDLALPIAFLGMDVNAREKCYEVGLTEALREWSNDVARVMQEESWHLAVVAVPASVAELVDAYPKIVHSALLHHSIRQPLHWSSGGKLARTTSGRVEELLQEMIKEYRILLHNKRYVRVPLRIPRYLFAHFFCTSHFPHSVTAESLGLHQLLSSSSVEDPPQSGVKVKANEEEILLGLQLTVALHRLRSEVDGPHVALVEQFLRNEQMRSQGNAGVGESGEDAFFQSQPHLEQLQRRMMPVAALRGNQIDWMRNYAEEAATAHCVTEKELACFDEYMLNSSGTDTVSDMDDDDENKSSNDGEEEPLCEIGISRLEDGTADVLREIEVLESQLDVNVRNAVFGTSCDDDTALRELAGNLILNMTVEML